MKTKIHLLLTALIALGLTFNSCKKGTDVTSPDYTSEFQSQADDQQRFSSETDAVANDANTAMESSPALNGGRIEGLICDANVTKDSITRVVTITYNGTSCDGRRIRTGVVTLSLPVGVQWKDAGAVLTITITNLKITRIRDNKSITINGNKTITNVSGGLLRNFGQGAQPITHVIASNGISVTFDNGTQRNWQVSKRRVFTYVNGIVITTTGTHTDGSDTTIAEWGTNRNGNAFESSTTQPMVISQACEWRVVSGQITHQKLAKTLVVTFGLDSNGNPTTCPGQGTYYFEAVWTNAKGKTQTLILPY